MTATRVFYPIVMGLNTVNQSVLQSIWYHCKAIMQEIDITEITISKAVVRWDYQISPGYMLVVDHITEIGWTVTCTFREC